jgi:hypothetical protein
LDAHKNWIYLQRGHTCGPLCQGCKWATHVAHCGRLAGCSFFSVWASGLAQMAPKVHKFARRCRRSWHLKALEADCKTLQDECQLLGVLLLRMEYHVAGKLGRQAHFQEKALNRHKTNYGLLLEHSRKSIAKMGSYWLEGKAKFTALHRRLLNIDHVLFWDEKHYLEVNSEQQ